MNIPLFIQKIWQKDNFTFSILWNDNHVQEFRLSELQKRCPCARCTDELTGKRLVDEKSIREDVRATVIQNVGRYALRIRFTSGCSTGIYSYDRLKNLEFANENIP